MKTDYPQAQPPPSPLYAGFFTSWPRALPSAGAFVVSGAWHREGMNMKARNKKSQPWQRLASLNDLARVFPDIELHSTRAPIGRKAGVHGQCPVCNSHRYLGKQLALSLDGGQHCAAVCDSCHAAVNVSGGYAFTVVHRLAQQQHYIKGAASC